jgi:tRNA nucleotidyltransferase (CCA-adding enzyme)
MKTYLVGGAVRDKLLGLPARDRDWVVTGATPEEMTELGFIPVGRDFPVFLHPQSKEEYALARTERKSGRGYHGFVFHTSPDVTLEEDLARRDLTINAMAEDDNGELIDPFNGRRDLEKGILRHVSGAFVEDPVRLLRVARYAARFATKYFTIASETMDLLKKITSSGELDSLVAERVWNEIRNALDESAPSMFFQVLRKCGALAVLLPEIDNLFGVPQSPVHHPEIDTGIHTMMVVDVSAGMECSNEARFAALVHDLGKGLTPPDILPRHIGHEERGLRLIDELCSRLRVPKEHRTLAKLACEFHTHCHRAAELRPSTMLGLFEKLDVFRRPHRLTGFLDACIADARGRTGFEDTPYDQAAILRKCFEAVREVDISDLVEQKASGDRIQSELRKRRIEKIENELEKCKTAD